MTSDVSEVTKTDEDVLILNVPDRVTSSETLNRASTRCDCCFWNRRDHCEHRDAGQCVAALAHVPAAQERSCCVRGCC